MKFLLVVALAVACSARPDIGLDYRTGGVSSSYRPSRTYIPSDGPGVVYDGSSSLNYNRHSVQVPSIHYDAPSSSNFNYEYKNRNYNYKSNQAKVITKTNVHHVSGPTHVTRNAFFYDSGDDHAFSQTRIHVPVAPTKKNVNLVFVKAPTYGHNTRIVAPQQQIEEKTRVIVLVKKPDDNQEVTLPVLAPARPSKPEVLFVKYNNEQEAQDKISATLHGARGAAHYANELGSERGLLNSIAKSTSQHTVGVTVDKYVNDAAEAEFEAGAGGHYEEVHSGGHETSSVHHTIHDDSHHVDAVHTGPISGSGSGSFTSVVKEEVHQNTDNHPGYTYKK